MSIQERLNDCRERLADWDSIFFNAEKGTNKFVGYAISRGLLSTSLLGIVLNAKVGIAAVTILPPKDEAVYLAGSAMGTSLMMGLTTLMLIAGGRARRDNRSLQNGPR